MKLKVRLTVCAVVLVAVINAQQRCPRCPQGICEPSCTGERNIGTNCTTAPRRRLWYYDTNSHTCRPLPHLGCGGNNNRWCSKLACTIRCVLGLG